MTRPAAGPGRPGLVIVVGLVLVFAGCLFVSGGGDEEPPPPPGGTGAAVAGGPLWSGEARLASGLDFREGEPRPTDTYGATIAYTDFQDRLSAGGRGDPIIAPWMDEAGPTYEQCSTVLQGSAYDRSAWTDLPIVEGAGYCINDSNQVLVFVRLLGRDGEALRINATVWPIAGSQQPTATLPPIGPRPPAWSGEVRLADGVGISFDRGEPGTLDPAFAQVYYIDRQSRLLAGNFTRSTAPWNEATEPTYEDCRSAARTNAYSDDESSNLPVIEGAGYCIVDDDVTVFLRLLGRDGEALRSSAVVWNNIG